MPFGLNIGDLLLMILADGSQLRKDIETQGLAAANAAGPVVGKSLGASIAGGLTKSGKVMSQVGKSMSLYVTAPVVAAGVAITDVGLKFDTTLRRIVALTDVEANQIGNVRDALLKMSTEVGKSPQELAEAFYFLASGGFNATESIEVLNSAAHAAAAGLGETQDVAKVLGASINAFGKDELTAKDATDQLIRAIKDGTAEAPDFAGALGDVVGSAGLLGASFSDTAGSLAAMTLVGISADEAATSLNQVFRALIKTTPQAERAFASVGLTTEGLEKQLREEGLLSLLKTLEERFADNDEAAGKAFGNVRALRGVLALLGEHLPATERILTDVAGGATTMASAFDETEGPGRRVDRALARIQVVLIQLSEDVLPVFVEIMEAGADILSSVAQVFKSLPGPARDAAVRIAGIAAALGPLLFISGKVVGALGSVVGAIEGLATSRVGKRLAGALFGPIIDAASGAGSKIAKPISSALASAISSVAGNAAVSKATSGLGQFLGSTLGKFTSVAFAAVMWFEVFETYNRIQRELAAQNAQIDEDLSNQLRTGTTEEIETSKRVLEEQLQELNKVWDAGLFTTETRKRLEANLSWVDAELARRSAGFGPTIAANLENGEFAVDEATGEIVLVVKQNLDDLDPAAAAAGKNIPESMANEIIKNQNQPVEALEQLKYLMKNELTKTQRIGRDIGILTSKRMAEAARDNRPGVQAEFKRTVDVVSKDLAQMVLEGGKTGKEAMEKLRDGVHSKNPRIRRVMKAAMRIVKSELAGTKKPAHDAGANTAESFLNGLKTQLMNSLGAFRDWLAGAMGSLGFVPKVYEDNKGHGKAIGGPVQSMTPYRVNENTPRSEWFVPSTGGHILTHSAAMRALSDAASGGGGGDVVINMPVSGALPVSTISDLSGEMQRIDDTGVLPDRRVAPMYNRRLAAGPGARR